MSILDYCVIILIAMVWLCACEATIDFVSKKLMYTRKLGPFGCTMVTVPFMFIYAAIGYWVMTITIM